MVQADRFEIYTRARNQITSYLSETTPNISAYWQEEISSLSYLFDATPTLVSRWREHCFWLTGDFVYRYKDHHLDSSHFHKINFRFNKFKELYPNYDVIEEPRILSAFGYEIEKKLLNIDTLKFNESCLAISNHFGKRHFGSGDTVIEIGGGWGGMAHTFLSNYPGVKYVIIDLPEILLFSAVWLSAAFPNAKIDLCMNEDVDYSADIVLVPNTNLAAIKPPNPKIVINICSFQEMTKLQIQQYGIFASQLKVPYIYSHNRDKGPYNSQLDSVTDSLQKTYSLDSRMEIFPADYTKMVWVIEGKNRLYRNKQKKKRNVAKKGQNPYQHLLFKLRD